MKLYDYIDKDLLEKMINEKYINVQVLEEIGYSLYNYSRSCTLEHVWNDATEKCRGLIVDKNDNIIARPFKKFYNYEEIEDKSVIPNENPLKIYEKKDGSLGILYWTPGGNPYIATRGSFNSEQAKWATDFLYNSVLTVDDECEVRELVTDYHYDDDEITIHLDRVKYTLLFEIVYPENKLVVNYGGEKSLTLLAIIDNETGEEKDPEELSEYFTVIKSYDGVSDWKNVREQFSDLSDTEEGFVVKFRNNFRLKLKFEEYFRKHFVISGLSKKNILEFLSNNDLKGIGFVLGYLDEENQIYYKSIAMQILNRYHDIELDAYREYKEFDTDKEAAEYFKTCKNTSILFSIRRNKDYSKTIWRQIKEEIKEEKKCSEED